MGLCEDDLPYAGRRGSTRALERLFTVTACYQCFPMVRLKFLVTSFERFAYVSLYCGGDVARPARKISSAETLARLRPADSYDPKPGALT